MAVARPRILHIEGSSKFGGDSVLILELGKAAAEHGYDVDVLATDPQFCSMVEEAGLGLVPLDVVRREIRPLWDARGLARLTSFLRHTDYTIVHTHTSKPGLVGRRAARWAGVPGIVHTVHLFPFHEETAPVPRDAYVRAERIAARWCDRIVTVSEHFRSWALQLGIGSPDQVVSIPNGVPVARTTPSRSRDEVRAELGLSDAFVLLFTGRLAEQKGLEYLLAAAPRVLERVPGATILLAGDGPLRDELMAMAQANGVGHAVRFLGYRGDIGDLLAAADLVVMPSLWEGLSISLLEAMAAAKAIVTTDIGGNREATAEGSSARLVPPRDPAALADAICTLAHDQEGRSRLGRLAQGVQQSRFTMPRMLDAYMKEYDRLGNDSTRSHIDGVTARGMEAERRLRAVS